MCKPQQATPPANPLRNTLLRLNHHLAMARATPCDEATRIERMRSATFLAEAALWQLDHHPAYAANRS